MLGFIPENLGGVMKKILLGLLFASTLPVNAASFVNGDFAAGGTGWNEASGNGSVTFSGGQAILETGSGTDAFSSVMVQGDNGFFSFNDRFLLGSDVATLQFDALFDRLDIDSLESGGGFLDALFVSLYDFADITGGHDLLFDPVIDSTLDGLLLSYTLNVSALQGREIALSFELSDDNDGYNSRVTLDNIRFAAALTSGSVPAPSVLVLLLAGLPLVQRFNKQRQI